MKKINNKECFEAKKFRRRPDKNKQIPVSSLGRGLPAPGGGTSPSLGLLFNEKRLTKWMNYNIYFTRYF